MALTQRLARGRLPPRIRPPTVCFRSPPPRQLVRRRRRRRLHPDGGGITFTNPTAIAISDNASATPYPSNIVVAGMPGAVTKVTVKLNDITHSNPTDMDMLLIGPGGQTAMIMSDAGGFPGITDVTLTLDDFAANPLPGGTPAPPVVTGTYKPTNYGRARCVQCTVSSIHASSQFCSLGL